MSQLWYSQSAKIWEEAMPLGNGRLGAMVFGNLTNERIQVNEESIWYGGPVNRNNPDLKKYLPQIRELIFNGEIKKAEELMVMAMSGCPNGVHPYQTLGDINIRFEVPGEIKEYRRSLDLEQALCKITYNTDAVNYTREIFISNTVAEDEYKNGEKPNVRKIGFVIEKNVVPDSASGKMLANVFF